MSLNYEDVWLIVGANIYMGIKQNFIILNTNINRIALVYKSDRGIQRRCKICSTKENPKTIKKICQEFQVNSCSYDSGYYGIL